MLWQIEGASEESGDEIAIRLEAPTRAAAEAEARRRGVLVASIESVEMLSPVDEVAAAAVRRQEAIAAINYQARQSQPVVPKYVGLRVAAGVLGVIAVIYYLAGLAVLAVVI